MDRPTRIHCSRDLLVAITTLAAFYTSTASATTLYPDVMGNTVWFQSISENTKTVGDPEPLYGPPTALGDTLDFNPNNFNFVASSNSGVVDTTDGALSLMIEAKPGYILDTIRLDESGLVNLFTLSGDPFAAVTGLLEITILQIDGMPIAPIKLPGIMPNFSPSGGDFQHSVDAIAPLYSSQWTGEADVFLFDELVSLELGYDFGVTKVAIEIDNFLLAAAGGEGSLASIDKKDFSITVDTGEGERVDVPEPTAILLVSISVWCVLSRRKSSGRFV